MYIHSIFICRNKESRTLGNCLIRFQPCLFLCASYNEIFFNIINSFLNESLNKVLEKESYEIYKHNYVQTYKNFKPIFFIYNKYLFREKWKY